MLLRTYETCPIFNNIFPYDAHMDAFMHAFASRVKVFPRVSTIT